MIGAAIDSKDADDALPTPANRATPSMTPPRLLPNRLDSHRPVVVAVSIGDAPVTTCGRRVSAFVSAAVPAAIPANWLMNDVSSALPASELSSNGIAAPKPFDTIASDSPVCALIRAMRSGVTKSRIALSIEDMSPPSLRHAERLALVELIVVRSVRSGVPMVKGAMATPRRKH